MKNKMMQCLKWMKAHKKRTITIFLVGTLAVGSLWRGVFAKNESEQSIQTQAAITGSIEKTVEGSGTIASAATQSVSFSSDVTVRSVSKKDGDTVKKGDTIAVLSSSSLEDKITNLENQITSLESTLSKGAQSASDTITSKVSGRVKRIYAKKGVLVSKTMGQSGALMEISADGKLKVTFSVKNSVKLGDKVSVKFGSYRISSKITGLKSGKATVRILDSYDYNVDTKAAIYNSSGKKIGSGILKSNSPITVTGTGGVVDSIEVSKNQKVYAGTTLITLSDTGYSDEYKSNLRKHEDLETQLKTLKKERSNLTVIAKYNGVVSGNISKGSIISKNRTVCKIVSTDSYKVSIDVDELDIRSVKIGQTVKVTADAVEDEEFIGKVAKVSKIGTNTNGVATYPVTIELESAEELLPAMSATAVITTEKAEKAVLVPIAAVQTKNEESYVTIVNNDEEMQTKVQVGIMNDTYAQITSGVKEGDQVKIVTRSSSKEQQDMKNMKDEMKDGAGERPGGNMGGGTPPSGAK